VKARELREHCQSVADWVDWDKTCDNFLWGDPETEVSGISCCWCSTLPHLRRAMDEGRNFFVVHEGLFVYREDDPLHAKSEDEKARFLDDNDIVIMRCHDTWDVFPELGIVDAWSRWLGFALPADKAERYYNAHDLPKGTKFGEMIELLLDKTKPIGQEAVHYIGDPNRKVRRIALGTGAITHARLMGNQLDSDVIVLTDDGTRLWETAGWAVETDTAVIMVDHATAEEPGMIGMAEYFGKVFDVPVAHIPQGCLYRTMCCK